MYAWVRPTTIFYEEKVRSQYLSLRQFLPLKILRRIVGRKGWAE